MTKFLQRLQLCLWAVAIILAVAIPLFTNWESQLNGLPVLATYLFNLFSVVMLLVSGYCVMIRRKKRVLKLTMVNITILFTETLYFMMRPGAQTMLYIFLIALLLSIIAYPLREPKKPEEALPAAEAADTAPEPQPQEEETLPAEEPTEA